MNLEVHPEAGAELEEAQAWYEERSEVAAQAFALEIDEAVQKILGAPLRYPRAQRGERHFVLNRFPYTIIYKIRRTTVFITAFAHQSRRPGYWRRRR